MGREIRQLVTEQDFAEFARISVNAYPGSSMTAENAAKRFQEVSENDATSQLWGLHDDDHMVGGMRLHDFKLNYFGTLIPAGGVGAVAVDLMHKKKGVARDLINFFLDHYTGKGSYLGLLYPFRPDFYYRMGFGYGQKMNQYTFSPSSLPLSSTNHGLVCLTADDLPLLEEFYTGYTSRQHGYCLKSSWELQTLFKGFSSTNCLVGYKKNGKLLGYMAFAFRKAHETNFVKNNLVIREWLWDGPEALAAFCSFLHTQTDQINRVVYNTQHSDFHFLLKDVRNGTDNLIPPISHESNTAGVGIMYRVISLAKFLQATAFRDFNGVTLNLILHVEDTFRPENTGTYYVAFKEGQARVRKELFDGIEMSINMADLSSLLMGSVEIASLYRLGKVKVSEEALSVLRTLFRVEQKPECITPF